MRSGVSLLLILVSTEIWECWCNPWNINVTEFDNENVTDAWNTTEYLDLQNETSPMENWTDIYETTSRQISTQISEEYLTTLSNDPSLTSISNTKTTTEAKTTSFPEITTITETTTFLEETSENTTKINNFTDIASIPKPTEKQFPLWLIGMIFGLILLQIICLFCCLNYLLRKRNKKMDSKGKKVRASPSAANMKAKRMGRLQTAEDHSDDLDPDLDCYIGPKESTKAILGAGENDKISTESQTIEFDDEYEVREISKRDDGRDSIELKSQKDKQSDPCIQTPDSFSYIGQQQSSSQISETK